MPVNPKGATIFGYESVTSIAAIEPAVDLAVIVPFMVDAQPVIARLAGLASAAFLPLMHSMMGTLPRKDEWLATLERAGVPMFNDVEEMAEAARLPARYPILRNAAKSERLPPVTFNDRKAV